MTGCLWCFLEGSGKPAGQLSVADGSDSPIRVNGRPWEPCTRLTDAQ